MVVGLGTNYIVTTSELNTLVRVIGPQRKLVLINTYEPDQWSQEVNVTIGAFVRQHPTVVLADWYDTIRHRTYLLWPDETHPQLPGTRVYAHMVYRAVQATREIPSARPPLASQSHPGTRLVQLNGLRQRVQGGREDPGGRGDQPGADLAGAGHPARHAGVDAAGCRCAPPAVVSIPAGVPRKPRAGTVEQRVLGRRVISYMRRVVASASATVPPTNRTMAGAAAMAKPPRPAVSVIAESPMSGLASAGP